MTRIVLCLATLLLISTAVLAQEFEIKKYDLNARVIPDELKVDIQARLRMVNLSSPDLGDKILLSTDNKPKLSFFINQKARIETIKVNDTAVTFKTAEDVRNNLLRVSTDITSTIASSKEFDIEMNYSVPSADRSTSLHISAEDTFLFPASFWVPVVHTPYAEHGADSAPVTLKVTAPAGMKVISSGIRKSETSFEQSMAAQPFFVVGDYEVLTRGGSAHPVEVYFPRGSNETARKQAEKLAVEAEKMITFFAGYFDVAAMAPFRVITTQARQLSTATTDSLSQTREVLFSTVGAVTVDDNLFRRDAIDLGTIELMAGAASRAWIDGQVLLRGRGTAMLRDALPIYLAAQYIGERYGESQRSEAFDRYRRAYSTIARSDAPLLMQSQIDRNYTTSVYNKGALIWRLIESQAGRQVFEKVLRSSLNRTRVDVLSLNEWRSPLCDVSRCTNLKTNLTAGGADRRLINEIFANWIDTVVLPDFAIGQPQSGGGGLESTIANFGTGDITIDILATTDKGEKIRRSVTVKSSEYGTVTFPAGTNIASIEADPERLFIQADYTNDIYPRKASDSESFGLANMALSRNDFTAAETKAREALKTNPIAPTLHALLGRALLGQKKYDEAAKVFETALKLEPQTIQAYGWAHQGLGDIASQKNQHTEAAMHYNLAAAADLDAASTIVTRDGALKAERAANSIKIPDEVRGFLKSFDAAVLQSTAAEVNPFVDLGNLRRFAQSLVVRKPSGWETEPLRAEVWDANRTAIDVALKIKIEGKDYSGRAVYVISKTGGKISLSEVPVFDVK